jgi:hypothetical protein
MKPDCDICQGTGHVRLIRHRELQCAPTPAEEMIALDQMYRTFPCPQCVPMVPYRKVCANRVISEYDVDEARKFQEPIKRSLAAAFGVYLLRKGLISFTTDESERLSNGTIKIIAEMGAVAIENAEKAGASVDVVETDAPPLPAKLQRQLAERASWAPDASRPPPKPWEPGRLQPEPVTFRRSRSTAEKVRDVRESRESARDRFSGLELFQDDGEMS